MEALMRRTFAFTLLMVSALPVPASAASSPSPSIIYRHLWTDTAGKSHFTMCTFSSFDLKSMSPPASPQWQDKLGHGGMSAIATIQPSGWDGAWHEDPKPQWIIPLSGHWFIQAQDGTRFQTWCRPEPG